MTYFHLKDPGKNWPIQILFIVLILIAYMFVGQIPITLVLVKNNLLNAESTASVSEMATSIGFNNFLIYLLIPFLVTFATILLGYKFLLKKPMISVFTNRPKLDFKRIAFSFLVWFAIIGLFLGISIYSGDPIVWNMNPETIGVLILIAVFLIPIQTTCEEVLFRGYLMQLFGSNLRKGWVTILTTGLLFGIVHGANPEVAKIGNVLLLYYIGTGLFLGVLTVMDDGLELSIGYHAANNIFAALIVTNDWQAFHTDALFMDHSGPQFGWDSILTLVVLQPLLVLLFAKVYKWTGWKERLIK